MILRSLILIQTFLAFRTSTEVQAANHRCYVCVPNTGSTISDVVQMFPEGTIIPLCSQFHTERPEYERECPSPSYQGCLTQTNGSHVTKTCTEVGIEDCKTANKIKYCYCKDPLCNRESVPTEAPLPSEIAADDDEDSPSEGSGSSEASDSQQMETSSEGDLGLEVIRRQFPPTTTATTTTTTTTTKSVILTTPRPGGHGSARSDAAPTAQPLNVFCLSSFLLVFRFNVHSWN